jgi:hypothetical protein
MKFFAMGKWSKADKRWNMVVALRRPAGDASSSSAARPARRKAAQQKLHKNPEA